MAFAAGGARKRKRPNRPAAQRREQYERAHAKVAQTLIKGLTALNHRGCQRTKLGDALLVLLSTKQQADHGEEDMPLYAASQPWPWQWQWPQAYVPWPDEPAWHTEQVPLEVPFSANSNSTPLAAAPTRALGPAAEDLESNWSFSCKAVAPDGWPSHRSSTSSHENSAAPVPAPLGETEVRDCQEEATDTTALTTSVAVQPVVSLSKTSPSLAGAIEKPTPRVAEEDSSQLSSRAKADGTKPLRLSDCSTSDKITHYIEWVVAQKEE